jgi:hypothetical protein
VRDIDHEHRLRVALEVLGRLMRRNVKSDVRAGAVLDSIASALSSSNRTDGSQVFTVAALREMTGLENTALNRYAKRAHVTTPGRGRKNHVYSATEARAILRTRA